MVGSTPRPHFTPGKDPVPIVQEPGWAPGPVRTAGKSRPHWDSIPDLPSGSQLLYRLSYQAHTHSYIYKHTHIYTLSLSLSIYIYMHTYICIYMYIYMNIYIYIYVNNYTVKICMDPEKFSGVGACTRRFSERYFDRRLQYVSQPVSLYH